MSYLWHEGAYIIGVLTNMMSRWDKNRLLLIAQNPTACRRYAISLAVILYRDPRRAVGTQDRSPLFCTQNPWRAVGT